MPTTYLKVDDDHFTKSDTNIYGGTTVELYSMTGLRANKLAVDNQSAIYLALITAGVGIGCTDPG